MKKELFNIKIYCDGKLFQEENKYYVSKEFAEYCWDSFDKNRVKVEVKLVEGHAIEVNDAHISKELWKDMIREGE